MEHKKMTAKEFLNQIKKLERLEEHKKRDYERLKDLAHGITAFSTDERVQSSGNHDRMADAVARYVDVEMEIAGCIVETIVKKNEILKTIEELNADDYEILHIVYAQNIPLKEAAVLIGKSYSCVTTLHGRALKNLQRILDERAEEEE